jgi:hypothetical protein
MHRIRASGIIMGHRMNHAKTTGNHPDFTDFINLAMTCLIKKAAIRISCSYIPIVQHYFLYDNKNNSRYYL